MKQFEALPETKAGDHAERLIVRFYENMGYRSTYSGKHRLSPAYQGPVIGFNAERRRAPDFYLERWINDSYEDLWLECKGKYGPTFRKQPFQDFDHNQHVYARWETGCDCSAWLDYRTIAGEHYHRCLYIAFLHAYSRCHTEKLENSNYPAGLYVANIYELHNSGRYGTGNGLHMVFFDMECFRYTSLHELLFDEVQRSIFGEFQELIQATRPWRRTP